MVKSTGAWCTDWLSLNVSSIITTSVNLGFIFSFFPLSMPYLPFLESSDKNITLCHMVVLRIKWVHPCNMLGRVPGMDIISVRQYWLLLLLLGLLLPFGGSNLDAYECSGSLLGSLDKFSGLKWFRVLKAGSLQDKRNLQEGDCDHPLASWPEENHLTPSVQSPNG